MYEQKRKAHTINLLTARIEASEELLTLVARAFIANTSPARDELRQALAHATTYAGPSNAKQSLAKLAKAALGDA